MSQRPFISRLAYSEEPALPLSQSQLNALSVFRERVRSGYYEEVPHPCLCGYARGDILIAQRDRYGLPLRTVLCKGCGLMRSDPFLNSSSLESFYSCLYRQLYSSEPDCSETEFRKQLERGKRIHDYVAGSVQTAPAVVFEVGCGPGGNLVRFKSQGATIAGCDYGAEALEYGKAQGLDLVIGGVESLKRFGKADLILLSHVVEHFVDPVKQLREIRKVLRPDGLLYIEVPGIFSIRPSYGDPLLYLQNAHAWNFCLETLDSVLACAGFKRVAGDETICAIYRRQFIPSVVNHQSNRRIVARTLFSLKTVDYLRRFPKSRAKSLLADSARSLLGRRLYGYLRVMGRRNMNQEVRCVIPERDASKGIPRNL